MNEITEPKSGKEQADEALQTLIKYYLGKLWKKIAEKSPKTAYWLSAFGTMFAAAVAAFWMYCINTPPPATEEPKPEVVVETNVVDKVEVEKNTNTVNEVTLEEENKK